MSAATRMRALCVTQVVLPVHTVGSRIKEVPGAAPGGYDHNYVLFGMGAQVGGAGAVQRWAPAVSWCALLLWDQRCSCKRGDWA